MVPRLSWWAFTDGERKLKMNSGVSHPFPVLSTGSAAPLRLSIPLPFGMEALGRAG